MAAWSSWKPWGPTGRPLSIILFFDAIRAGFNKVVFIIRKDFEQEFTSQITDKYAGKIQVEFAFQDLHDLPDGFTCPEGREKPWGTGHAILTATDLIHEPFVAINGDDFYGRETFDVIVKYYQNEVDSFSMAAFRLYKTLSTFGGVTRGICTVVDDKLETVIETENIQKTNNNTEIQPSADRFKVGIPLGEPLTETLTMFLSVVKKTLQFLLLLFLQIYV